MTLAAVVLISHGTVESLDDLPEFLTNIRRGHAPPPDLIAEVRRRYEAIGGKSPLNDIGREVAAKLEARLEMPVRNASRLFHPYPKDVIAKLAAEGVRKIITIPLAQHSAPVYASAMRAAAKEVDASIEIVAAGNWGRTPALTQGFAEAVATALAKVPAGIADQTAVVFTAHSLPLGIIQAGDPYEKEFRASVADVVELLSKRAFSPSEASGKAGELAAPRTRTDKFAEHAVAFQSQGIGTGMEWLGPDLRATLEKLKANGRTHIVVAPIGFLADHVEILYDLDIEAKAWAQELGIVLYRSTSLNAETSLIDALVSVTKDIVRG